MPESQLFSDDYLCNLEDLSLSRRYLFTSESVTEGHPDKICDQISDTILDALLTQDPKSRVAAEVVVNTGLVLITGEITSQARVNYVNLTRKKIAEIGYTHAENGFSADSCSVLVALDEQSADIAQGVDAAAETREEKKRRRIRCDRCRRSRFDVWLCLQ
jgi:S-adenosylmethionine synthetase